MDQRGTSFSENFTATGFGSHLGLPLIRDRWCADMSEAEARTLLEDCMRVLWYRDTRALNKIQIAKITAAGEYYCPLGVAEAAGGVAARKRSCCAAVAH